MTQSRMRLLHAVVTGLFSIIPHTNALAQDSAAHTAIIARWEQLQNWSARVDMSIQANFDPAIFTEVTAAELQSMQANGHLNQTQNLSMIIRFLNGRYKVESELDAAGKQAARAGKSLEVPFEIRTFAAGRAEHLVRRDESEAPAGVIRESDRIPDFWTFDIGVGLRLVGDLRSLDRAELARAALVTDGESALLRIKRDGGREHEMRFDRRVGYAMTSYRFRLADNKSEYQEELTCSDFRVVEGTIVPFKMFRQSSYRDSRQQIRHPYTFSVTVREFTPGDPSNTDESMLIRWDAGMLPLDMRSGLNVAVGPTSRPLTDTAIAAELAKQQELKAALEQRARERIERNTTPPTSPGVPGR